MSTLMNWQVAEARTDELKRLEASVDSHPFARFVSLAFEKGTGREAARRER